MQNEVFFLLPRAGAEAGTGVALGRRWHGAGRARLPRAREGEGEEGGETGVDRVYGT